MQKGPYVDSDIGILLLLVYYNIFILDVCVYQLFSKYRLIH